MAGGSVGGHGARCRQLTQGIGMAGLQAHDPGSELQLPADLPLPLSAALALVAQ